MPEMTQSEISKSPRHWFHIPIQVVVAGFRLYWHWHIPAPNKAVLWLAGVAAIMALVEMRPIHKAIYFLLIIGLMFTENRAIDKDRSDFSQAEGTRRGEEKQQFSNVGEAITSNVQRLLDHSDGQFRETVSQQSDHFDAMMGKEQANINEITGGDSYAVVFPAFNDPSKNTFRLAARACDRCEYSLPRADIYFQTDLGSSDNGPLIYSGPVDPNFGVLLPSAITPPVDGETDYRVTVFARNKPTFETLKVRFDSQIQRWEYSLYITREQKRAHRNPETKMAEGEVLEVLEDSPWQGNVLTPMDRARTTLIH